MTWPTASPNEKARRSNRTKPRSARALLSWQQMGLAEVLSGSAVARAVVAKIVRSRPPRALNGQVLMKADAGSTRSC